MAQTDSSPIPQLVESRLIPWATQRDGMELVVARSRLKTMKGTTQLALTPKKMQGPRKAMRNFTFGGLTAQWPNDELLETQAPLLLFVLQGNADLHCGDYILHAPQGQAVFVPGGVPRWTGVETLEHLGDDPDRFSDAILFSERCGSLLIWMNHIRGNQHFSAQINEILIVHNVRLLRLLEEIGEEVTAQSANFQAISQHLLKVFLLTLQRDLQEGKAILPGHLAPPETAADSSHAPIVRAQGYVRDHMHESLTQDKIARLVRLSRTQFIRRFRQETGQSFNQFVTQCRLEHAQTLLQNTDFPLTFICLSVGFKSPSHFNAVFRRHFGMSPVEFRAQKETNNDDA